MYEKNRDNDARLRMKYESKTHQSPLWLDTSPVFLGRVEWCGGTRSAVAILGTGATLRVDRDEEQVLYRRKLRFVLGEDGAIERVLDERGVPVDLADWGCFETSDRRVLTLDVISDQPNPRWSIEKDTDGTWYHPAGGGEPTFVPTGEDPEKILGCSPSK